MSFIFWSDVTFIYTMYYIIIYVICQIGNYLVDTYLFPRFYVRHSVCTEYCLYYKCGVLIYQLGAPYCTIPCNILPTWKKEPSYISQTLFWGLTNIKTYHTVQVCAGISQHFLFVTHSDDYGTFAVIHHLNGSEVAAFVGMKAAIAKLMIRGEGK